MCPDIKSPIFFPLDTVLIDKSGGNNSAGSKDLTQLF